MLTQSHNGCNIFATKNVDIMISPGCKAFFELSDKRIRAHKYCQIKTCVQTAHKSHDLNMDLCSFDNDFKQLCIMGVQWLSGRVLDSTEGPWVRPHPRHCVVVLEQDTFILA